MDFIRQWARDHRVASSRRSNLELAAEEIFLHLVTRIYRPGQPGSIAVTLEEKGPRLRLIFEDDAAGLTPGGLNLPQPQGPSSPVVQLPLSERGAQGGGEHCVLPHRGPQEPAGGLYLLTGWPDKREESSRKGLRLSCGSLLEPGLPRRSRQPEPHQPALSSSALMPFLPGSMPGWRPAIGADTPAIYLQQPNRAAFLE